MEQNELQAVISGLSDSQKAVLGADDLIEATASAAANTRAALVNRGLAEEREGNLFHLTEAGLAVRGALIDLPPDPQELEREGWSQADYLDDLAENAELAPWQVDAGMLEVDELATDEVLDRLVQAFTRSGHVSHLTPAINDGMIFGAALAGAHAAVAFLDLEEGGGAEYLTDSALKDIFAGQWMARERLPAETLFRIHRDGDEWPDCPKWLEVFLEAFGGVVHALKPLAERDRAEIEARVAHLLRERRTEGVRKRRAAKIIKKREKRAARPGVLAAAKAAREERRAQEQATEQAGED